LFVEEKGRKEKKGEEKGTGTIIYKILCCGRNVDSH
jgi:hypothetical protein